MKLGSIARELKRPNACVLILVMLMPVLALLMITDNATAATCSCPYGGQYYSSIHTSLCGWQYNVCVTFDYNCANDYHAVCGTTTTHTTSTRSTTTRSTTTIRTGTSCGYIEFMMGGCGTTTTRTTSTRSTATRATTTIKTGTSCSYIEIMMGQCPQGTQSYTQPTVRTNCDPSYPTVCIPPPPPDLDCKDIPYRRFRVLPPDPHNFDGDHDGIGCEWD
jgi:hypothetical protein